MKCMDRSNKEETRRHVHAACLEVMHVLSVFAVPWLVLRVNGH
jgi:hypothetical protein